MDDMLAPVTPGVILKLTPKNPGRFTPGTFGGPLSRIWFEGLESAVGLKDRQKGEWLRGGTPFSEDLAILGVLNTWS